MPQPKPAGSQLLVEAAVPTRPAGLMIPTVVPPLVIATFEVCDPGVSRLKVPPDVRVWGVFRYSENVGGLEAGITPEPMSPV